MGLTLLEAAKTEQDAARVAVIRELAESELISAIPFRNTEGGGLDYMVESDLPSVGFRGFNETLDDSVGVLNPQYERLKIFGGDIDVDTAQIDMQGEQARADQIQMKIRSMRLTFEDYCINGSEATDPRAFDGLKTRIVTTSSQAVNVNGALSLGLLDELMDAVDSGSGEKECAAPEDPVDDDAEPGLDALNELIGRLLNAIRDADATIPVSIAALEAAKTLFLSQVYDLRPRFEE